MTVLRIGRSPPVRKLTAGIALADLPPIVIKKKPSLVIECPTDSNLVSDVLDATPRIVRRQRRDGYTHVSDLITSGKCVRRISISDKFGVPLRPQRLRIADRIVFAIGDAIHDEVKSIASEGAPDRVWGLWKCSCGHLYHEDPCCLSEIDPDDICPLCGTASNVYKEVPIYNEQYGIVGNPDLLMYIEECDAFHVTELKSIAPEAWADLVRPQPAHVLQVLFYWWLMMEAGYRLTDLISIVYITKGYQFKGKPQKEFMIDPAKELHRLIPYLEDARLAKLSLEHNVFPARKVCSGQYDSVARKCEVCEQCFTLP